MYFLAGKIVMDLDTATTSDNKGLASLVEKLRAKFKVAVKTNGSDTDPQHMIFIAAIGSSEQKLEKNFEEICEFCEVSGFGRIATDAVSIDHFDNIE